MSRENNHFGDYNLYHLAKLNTAYFLPQDQTRKFNSPNHTIRNNFTNTSPTTSLSHTYFSPSVTNDDGTSSCCSISEPIASDHPYFGVEDHADIVSDHDLRSPDDSPTTPTTPFSINVNPFGDHYSSWLSTTPTMPTIYENSFSQKNFTFSPSLHKQTNFPLAYGLETFQKNQKSPLEIPSPLQSSPSLSISSSSLSDDLETIGTIRTNGTNGTKGTSEMNETKDKLPKDQEKIPHDDTGDKRIYQKKSKEEIYLKYKLPVNGIATRTRSKRTIPAQVLSPSKKKLQRLQMSEEEKTLQKYSSKVAPIPSFSRKVTIPSQNVQEETTTPITGSKNPNYPIPKTQRQVLSNWTIQEQKNFLALYLSEGKNFGRIAKTLNKSIKEVVEIYYYCKMSPKFRIAKSLKKELFSYSSKLDQISNSITKLKHLSSVNTTLSSPPPPVKSVKPVRLTVAQSVIHRKRRGRPKKGFYSRF